MSQVPSGPLSPAEALLDEFPEEGAGNPPTAQPEQSPDVADAQGAMPSEASPTVPPPGEQAVFVTQESVTTPQPPPPEPPPSPLVPIQGADPPPGLQAPPSPLPPPAKPLEQRVRDELKKDLRRYRVSMLGKHAGKYPPIVVKALEETSAVSLFANYYTLDGSRNYFKAERI